jgi:hypothetical protein
MSGNIFAVFLLRRNATVWRAARWFIDGTGAAPRAALKHSETHRHEAQQ